jgi:hypothetical protein
MEVSDQLHTPAALPPGKSPRWGWVGPRAGLNAAEKEKLSSATIRTPSSQPLARRYTDWAVQSYSVTITFQTNLYGIKHIAAVYPNPRYQARYNVGLLH